jgi:Phage tail assembly chaperone proteins, E, or 41 or 14
MSETKDVEPAPEGSITVTLTKPIPVFNDKVAVLKFRAPTGGDLIRIGNPVIFDPITDPPRVTHDTSKMTVMMAKLSGIPASSLEFLNPQDWVACAWALTPFFMPARAI